MSENCVIFYQFLTCSVSHISFLRNLKEPVSVFFYFQTFVDFGIMRKLIFFHNPWKKINFTAEKCTVWKILIKLCLYGYGNHYVKLTHRQLQYTELL